MGLIQCPDCGSMISEHAPACPSCGCPAEYFNPAFQAPADYYPDPDQDYGSGSGGGILSGILKTAVGVAIGNGISDKGKKNYMDSPNCERAKTGRRTSCWGCGLSDHCTMYNK